MTKNITPTPVYLDRGMHRGLEVKGLKDTLKSKEPYKVSLKYLHRIGNNIFTRQSAIVTRIKIILPKIQTEMSEGMKAF